MGWWACSIMGGDQPLDFLDECARIAEAHELEGKAKAKGVEFFGWDFDVKEVKRNKIALEARCKEDTQYQVLGVLFMGLGISISNRLKNKINKAIDSDDEWLKHKERKLYLQEYRKKLNLYDNKTATHLSSEGLLKNRKPKVKKSQYTNL